MEGKLRFIRRLNQCDAAAILDRPQAGGPVVEAATQDNADDARPEMIGSGAEKRIDGRTETIFLRSTRNPDLIWLKQQMAIGHRDIDLPRDDGHAILSALNR